MQFLQLLNNIKIWDKNLQYFYTWNFLIEMEMRLRL